jgi:hypothetical protein
MLLRLFKIICFCVVITACNKNAQQTQAVTTKNIDSSSITEKDIEKLKYIDFALDPKAEVLAEPWLAYNQLKTTVENVKKADFSFFDDDDQAVFLLIKDLRRNIPDTLKTQSVLSRITIVENMLYKLEETYQLRTTVKPELAASIKALLISYSNLNFQLNKKLEKDNQNIARPNS